ncbi:MAG: OmpA family protein, partial [Candidatus Sulfotelmatobacter sp.]
MKTKLLLAAAVALSLPAVAQTNSQTTVEVEHMNSTPTFRVVVISRSVQAVNYEHRSGSSKLDFAGTDLRPSANGVA